MKKQITYQIAELTALCPPDKAGNDMITNLPVFSGTTKAKEVKQVMCHDKVSFDSLNYLYIVDKESVLKGVVSRRKLLH